MVGTKIGMSAALVVVVLAVAVGLRKRWSHLMKKYGSAWRDVLMVFSIQVAFVQVGGAVPDLIGEIAWPKIFLAWTEYLKFFRFDIMAMLGLTCLPGTSYELRFAATTSMLAVIVVGVLTSFFVKLRRLRGGAAAASAATKRANARKIFQSMDHDRSGSIDAHELGDILQYIQADTDEPARDVIQRLGGGGGVNSTILSEEQFVDALLNGALVKKGKTSKSPPSEWIAHVTRDALRSSHMSIAVQLFLLMHPPVSQKVFFYFNAVNLNGRHFLKADMSLEMYTPRWFAFLPFVCTVAVIFTVGVPLYVTIVLWRHRKQLYHPAIQGTYGFLYNRFDEGAELWEVHEILRKSILCGGLIYLPATTRSAVAILVCVVACCSLNFFRPPRNKRVFLVAEAAFLSTSLKYCGAVVLKVETDDGSRESLGVVLVTVDIIVMVVGFFAASAILWNLKRKVDGSGKTKKGGGGGAKAVEQSLSGPSMDQTKYRVKILPQQQREKETARENGMKRIPQQPREEKNQRATKGETGKDFSVELRDWGRPKNPGPAPAAGGAGGGTRTREIEL
jgi:hypothetical protein